jgi:hypothetical protein
LQSGIYLDKLQDKTRKDGPADSRSSQIATTNPAT